METAELFFTGQTQAVLLPKGYQFEGGEVGIRKAGNTVILFPVNNAWDTFLNGLNSFTDDFMENGRECLPEQVRESL